MALCRKMLTAFAQERKCGLASVKIVHKPIKPSSGAMLTNISRTWLRLLALAAIGDGEEEEVISMTNENSCQLIGVYYYTRFESGDSKASLPLSPHTVYCPEVRCDIVGNAGTTD